MPWEMTAIFPCVTLGIRYKRSYPYMFCRFNKLQVQNDYETYNMQRRVLLALTELERNQILIDCPTTSKFSTFQTMLVLEETLTANEFCASTHNEAGSSRPCSWLLRNLQHSDEGPSWMDLIVQVLLLGFVDLPDLVREIRQYYNDESLKADMYQVARGGLDRTEYDDGTKTFVSEVRKYGFSNFKVFLEEIKDIHFIITKPFYNFELERWTTQPGTLARAALAEQLSFWWFRFLLEYLNVNLEEFAIQECAVLDDGWTPKTFIALFEDQTPLYEDQFVFLDFDRSCRLCGSFPYTQYWSRNPWNELWREHVKKIKAGFSPDDPESEKERALQRDCERWTHGFACEDICIQCQLSMEEKLDMEREDCQENSPFLLDIDI
ncbi:hypothetical protein L228DRAFT_180078 [Xylona heveae TC161]|uniref:Uncharacterized protein n=1 Tax=Xylona heveae (strain CBS 132557 / TC161) TaxID=1328760 RepID=A0A165FCF1_XYLHT|nr:hypothetical protein L228DRAFT_180078 [Xylona heveae TC161]KZF20819.1 hypothetical protein L228DRAFT_180078 [Xylona heveae TC161]